MTELQRSILTYVRREKRPVSIDDLYRNIQGLTYHIKEALWELLYDGKLELTAKRLIVAVKK